MRINNSMYEIHHAILVRAQHITATIDYITNCFVNCLPHLV